MQERTRLLVLAGVHGRDNGEIGSRDVKFVDDCERQITLIKKKKKKEIEEGDIHFKVEDVGQNLVTNEGIRELDENKFIAAVKNFAPMGAKFCGPTVLVLAWCWSQQSELNDLLRAR